MRSLLPLTATTAALLLSTSALAASPIDVSVEGYGQSKPIPATYARCKMSGDGKSAEGENLRPAIRWSNAPKGTKSFAVFMMDPDVPADFSDAGKEGKVIAADAKRQDFFHYGVVNIPATATSLNGGHADTPPVGTELINDMGLNRYVTPGYAYGGPCPPWNDERAHHYHVIVLALDSDAPVSGEKKEGGDPAADPNTAKNTYNRLVASKHVLARGKATGTYTLNRSLSAKGKK